MSLTTLSIKTTFNRITGKVVIEDTTDYAGQGIDVSTAGLNGYLSITYDTGSGSIVLYNNIGGGSPDVTPASSTVATCDVNIPTTSDGKPVPASYTVTYNVVSGTLPADVTSSFEYTYSLTDAQICIGTQVNCLTSSITSTDDTDYGVLADTIVREHTLYPPPTSGQSVLGPLDLKTLVYSPISTTTWTAQVVSTVTYIQADSLNVIVSYSGSKEFQATCDVNLSKIICCLEGVNNYYEDILYKDTVKAAIYNNTVIQPTMRHLTLFLAAQSAGNYDVMTSEYQEILDASKCSENCGCGTDTPYIVQVLGGGSSGGVYVVDSPSGNISVTSTVVGDTTTYSLNLSTALLTAIAGIRQYTADTTTPAYLSVATTGTNPRNIRINWVGGVPYSPNAIVTNLTAVKNGGIGTYYTVSEQRINTNGTGVQTATIDVGTAVGASTEAAAITYSGFAAAQSGYDTIVNAQCQLVKFTNAVDYTVNTNIAAEVLYINQSATTGSVTIRMINPVTGNPYTLADLDGIVESQGATICLTINFLYNPA